MCHVERRLPAVRECVDFDHGALAYVAVADSFTPPTTAAPPGSTTVFSSSAAGSPVSR
jgi:hypothetical protein